MKTTAEMLCARLSARGVRFLLIGGYALPVYGVVRQTVDVDCLICDEDENMLRSVLEGVGYMERQRTEAFARFVHPLATAMDVDVMLVDRGTFDGMFDLSTVQPVGDASARMPALAHMIALKLHAIRHNSERELRDLGDIVELLRQNRDAVTADDLQGLCLQYGPDGICEKIRSYL